MKNLKFVGYCGCNSIIISDRLCFVIYQYWISYCCTPNNFLMTNQVQITIHMFVNIACDGPLVHDIAIHVYCMLLKYVASKCVCW